VTGNGRADRGPGGLHPDALQRLAEILGSQLSDVFAKHREIEAATHTKNNIGRQNLVEGLAHIGVLFQRAGDLDRDRQLEQVSFIEDHFRRVMMESFEGEVYAIIEEIWDSASGASVGGKYDTFAAPLIRQGKLLGHVTPEEVKERFGAISEQVVSARKAKVAHSGWSAWKEASDELKSAATSVKVLAREMGAAADAAGSMRTAKHRWLFGIGLSLLLFLGGAVGSHELWPAESAPAVTVTSPVPTPRPAP
jgi:hypothetical protein